MAETRHHIEFLSRAVRPGNPYEETVQRLLQSIRLGIIEPGERLPAERELAAMLGISRDTLRYRLQKHGMVRSRDFTQLGG